MYQIFQEYFKETKLKIFLKYDAEREKNVYTVMLVDVDHPDKNLHQNTDDPHHALSRFLVKKGISIKSETNELLLNTFIEFKNSLLGKLGDNLVFIFTIEKREQLEYYVSIISEGTTTNQYSTDFSAIREFVTSISL